MDGQQPRANAHIMKVHPSAQVLGAEGIALVIRREGGGCVPSFLAARQRGGSGIMRMCNAN